MTKLILTLEGQPINQFKLDKGRITIGRKPHNDIRIDNLAISGEHAAIITLGNDSFVEDLDSTNGTLVNGIPIKKHALRHGDEIEIGKYRLRYINLLALGGNNDEDSDHEKTAPSPSHKQAATPGVKHDDDPMAHTIALVTSKAAHRPKSTATPNRVPVEMKKTRAVIRILSGQNAGKELELTKMLTSLGAPGSQVAAITRRPHGYFITHVQGARYPAVNDRALDAHPRQLMDHDIIELGDIKMVFYLKQSRDRP